MRQVGPDSFEITNKKTGETKVVTGNDLPQYGLKKPFNAANIAPAAGGIIGGIAGSIGGPVGAGLGAAAGTAAGGMIKSLVTPKKSTEFADPTKTGFGAKLSQEGKTTAGKDITNISKDAAIAGASTYAAGKATEVAGKVLKPVGKYLKESASVKGSFLDKLKSLEPGKHWGTQATDIANTITKKVNSDKVIANAYKKIAESKVVGSTKQKALQELIKIKPDAPANIIDTLTGRRGVDSQIVRDLFGRAKTNVGKNVALSAYRSALNDVIKGIPELASLDKKLSIYYKIKDPISHFAASQLGKTVIGGSILAKVLGIGK